MSKQTSYVSEVQSLMISMIFHTETILDISFEYKHQPKKRQVRFEDDPITILIITKKSTKKFILSNLRNLSSERVNDDSEKEIYRLTMIFNRNKRSGLKRSAKNAEEELYLYFNNRSDFDIWKTSLNVFYRYQEVTKLTELMQVRMKKATSVDNKEEKTKTVSSYKSLRRNMLAEHSKLSSSALAGDQFNVYCFGNNEWGQLCQEGAVQQPLPRVSLALLTTGVKNLASGWKHTLIISGNFEILSAGDRIGSGQQFNSALPVSVKMDKNMKMQSFVNVACGEMHSLALTSMGKVVSWGSNMFGQLGRDDIEYYGEPGFVKGLEGVTVTHITAGESFSACLSNEGKVYTWGDGLFGQLGHGGEEDERLPKIVEGLEGKKIVLLKAGACHMIAVEKSSQNENVVYSWGYNGLGQLGLGDQIDRHVPTKMEMSINGVITQISCGAAHTAVLVYIRKISSNCVYMFGSNQSGQLGIPHTNDSKNIVMFPVIIPSDLLVERISCGANHTGILTKKGRIYTCGSNLQSQLGHLREKINEPELREKRGTLKVSPSSKNCSIKGNKEKLPGMLDKLEQNIDISTTSSVEDFLKPPEFFVSEFVEVMTLREKEPNQIVCSGNSTFVLAAKKWIPDSEAKRCMGEFSKNCKKDFTLYNRKHHCRSCGGIFCQSCSSKSFEMMDEDGNMREYRVCNNCYELLNDK